MNGSTRFPVVLVCLSFWMLTIFPLAAFAQVRVNEVMASNGVTLADEDGDFEDWIELYNEGQEAVDLTGWGLSDNASNAFKWTFPEGTVIGAGEYLLVWASGKDREPSGEQAGILREVWMGISGTSISNLTDHPDFPHNPTSRNLVTDFFEAPIDIADQYGQRMSALLVPPETGIYRFWIASDDNGELHLSSDENPENALLIASVPDWTPPREWDRFASQESGPIHLVADQPYFIAALMKEHGGGDNLAVAWQRPDGAFEGPIPAQHFRIESNEIHTNFRIASAGEELVLTHPNGEIADYFPPVYIPRDVSYGRQPDSGPDWFYFDQPTPGSANNTPSVTFPPSVSISEPRGFRTEPFHVTLTSSEPASTIRYTLDGSEPDFDSPVYTDPLLISQTTTLRAAVREEGMMRLPPTTATWIFLEDVLLQDASTPEGWPNDRQVNNKRMEYGMSSAIVTGDPDRLRAGMTAIPSISLVTDLRHLFDAETGIYVNPGHVGQERPVSVELIDPIHGSAKEFQIDAGLRIRGGFSRSIDNPKHSFRLLFRSAYGESQLHFPLFGDEGADHFDKVDLRTAQNYSWAFQNSSRNTFLRDVFSRDSQRDMGVPYTRSRFYHLYLNGQYWGLYQTQERAESDYAATYLGGDSDDWDVIKTSQPGYVTDANSGTFEAWHAFHDIAMNQGFTGAFADNYWRVKGMNPDGSINPEFPVYLDEENLSVMALLFYYTADPDSPVSIGFLGRPNNMYALFNREQPDGFKWLRHDAEHSLGGHGGYGVTVDVTHTTVDWTEQHRFNPITLHTRLIEHPEYRMQFADFVQRHLFGEGALAPDSAQERVLARMAEIDLAIIGESARWGRGRTRDGHWIPAANEVLNFLAQRRNILINQFQNRGWFPSITAPRLRAEDRAVRIGAETAFYYTTDGTDPRLPGGGINPAAILVQPPENGSQAVRLIDRGATWRYFDLGMQPNDQGSSTWRDPDFDDHDWEQGPAILGFAGAPTQNPVSTVTRRYVSGTSGPQVTTTYFRHTFSADDPGEIDELVFDLLRDDGAVVYLNGVELFRSNMPPGEPTYDTFASSVVASPAQNTYFTYNVPLGHLLEAGSNVLAVEIHQVNSTSSDIYFDLSLDSRGDAVSVGLPLARSDVIVARAFHDSEWSAKVELDADDLLPPGVTLHEWDFESETDMLEPSFTLGGGALTIAPGPDTEVLANTGGDFETQHLRVNNPLGATVTFALPTTGYNTVTLDFLTRRSGQGAGEQTLSFTTDGVSWTEAATYAVFNDIPQAQSFDFGGIAGVADNPDFAVKIEFGQGEGGTEGNNRFDDVIVRGLPLPGTNLPPVVNEETAPEFLVLTAGAEPIVFDLNDWFTDPEGDALAFTVATTGSDGVVAGLDGAELSVTGQRTGGWSISVGASDGTNPTIEWEVRFLIYPAPFVLDGANYRFQFWAANNPADVFPANMIFLQSDESDPMLTSDLAYAYHIPAADAARAEDVAFPYAAESRSRINGLEENGIAFINTGRGRDVGAALLALDTTGVSDIDVSWTGETLLPNSRIYGIRLQYRIGTTGAWTDVFDEGEPVEYVRSESAGDTATFGPIRLPSELEEHSLVQLQWRYHHIGVTSGPRTQLRLDDIVITSSGAPAGYAGWVGDHFDTTLAADPAFSGPGAAPFGDGVSNLLKYALGAGPNDRLGPEQLEQGKAADNRLFIRFYRNPELTDIAYRIEASTDLIDWSDLLFDSDDYSGENSDGEMHEVYLSIDDHPRRFLRLLVIGPIL